jgi:hypothetical protein
MLFYSLHLFSWLKDPFWFLESAVVFLIFLFLSHVHCHLLICYRFTAFFQKSIISRYALGNETRYKIVFNHTKIFIKIFITVILQSSTLLATQQILFLIESAIVFLISLFLNHVQWHCHLPICYRETTCFQMMITSRLHMLHEMK